MLMSKFSIAALVISCILLSGCISDIVTVPLGFAYDVSKVAVKGSVAVVGGTVDILTPDGKKKED
jgi:outer membrane murein-binding lipoprotein Lpp